MTPVKQTFWERYFAIESQVMECITKALTRIADAITRKIKRGVE